MARYPQTRIPQTASWFKASPHEQELIATIAALRASRRGGVLGFAGRDIAGSGALLEDGQMAQALDVLVPPSRGGRTWGRMGRRQLEIAIGKLFKDMVERGALNRRWDRIFSLSHRTIWALPNDIPADVIPPPKTL
jgi:hypothetical protein